MTLEMWVALGILVAAIVLSVPEWLRVGLPLIFITLVVAMLYIPLFFPF